MDIETKYRVLCIDDEGALRKLLGKAFEHFGFSVQTSESAEEALEILKTESFDAMIVDINLTGMSGIEFCRQVRAENSSAFMTAITGFASKFEFSDCKKAGFDAYFTKPLDMERLCIAVREECSRRKRQ